MKDSINRKAGFADAVILLCSLCSFSALHILQCGSKLILAIYAILFIVAYVTKKDKRILFKQWRISEIAVALLPLVIGFVYGYTSTSYSWLLRQYGFPDSSAFVIAVCGCMALLSLPGLMFILSWIREDSENPLIDKVADFLSGKIFLWTCAGISALGIAALVYFSFSYSIWIDEAFSMALTDGGYDKIISVTSQDVHPPLYYIILKFCVDGMRSIFPDMPAIYASKLVSVIPYVCMFAICMTWVRRQWGNCAAALAAVAVICVPPSFEHGVTIRMYSWSILWVFCCYLQAYRVAQKDTICNRIIFALYGLLAAYTNYWACVAVGVIYLYTCAWSIRAGKKSFVRWCVAALLSVLGYLPWLFYFVGQFQHVANGSCPWFTEVTILNYSSMLFGYVHNMFAVFIVVVCLSCFLGMRRESSKKADGAVFAVWGICIPWFVMIIGAILGLMYAPMMFGRHLLPGVACLWLGVCLSVYYIQSNRLKIVIPLIILPLAVMGISHFVKRELECSNDASFSMRELKKKNPKKLIVYDYEKNYSLLVLISRMLEQASLYMYGNHEVTVSNSIYEKSIIFQKIDKPIQIKELVNSGENVYYATISNAEAEEFSRDTRMELKLVGQYRFETFMLQVYQVESE